LKVALTFALPNIKQVFYTMRGQFLPTLSQQYVSVFERKFFKKVEIKFGEKKKVATFALPNEMRVLKRTGLGSS